MAVPTPEVKAVPVQSVPGYAIQRPQPRTDGDLQPRNSPTTVRVKRSGGFNGGAAIIILLGAFALFIGIRGTWKNVLAAFTPLSQSQIQSQTQGPTGSSQSSNPCPTGFTLVATSVGHKCVPTSSLH